MSAVILNVDHSASFWLEPTSNVCPASTKGLCTQLVGLAKEWP